jgi:hypothetical protein
MDNIVDTISKLSPGMAFGYSLINQDKESFAANDVQPDSPLMSIFSSLLIIVSLYLAFICNKRFDLGQILIALCCAPCHIAYRLAVPCKN